MKKGDLTKERIVAEATRLVNQKGVEATSLSDLISATGLKKGSLYFHFPGKEELTRIVIEKAKENFQKFLALALTGKTPGDCLDNFFNKVLEKHEKKKWAGG